MASKLKQKKDAAFIKGIGKFFLFILKTPYYITDFFMKSFIHFLKKKNKSSIEKKVKKKRVKMKSVYEEFEIIKGDKEKYNNWRDKTVKSDSVIGIILGARGTGKTAFGIKFLENIHEKYNKKCYALGFKKEEMPDWINAVDNISELKNNSFVLVDEGGILFNSRDSMSDANKLLSDLILIARHKNLSILFISQNSANLEVNILRQADFLILKPSSLLQKDFERKIIQKVYQQTNDDFKKLKRTGLTYIYADEFNGFITNKLPSFWSTKISKSFR